MKKLAILGMLLVALNLCPGMTWAAVTNPPNLIGTWQGQARGVGGGSFVPGTAAGAGSTITFKVTNQVDVRFIGTIVLGPPLGGGVTEQVSGVIIGNEIHGVDRNTLVTFGGKLVFNPPGKPKIEGYFLKYLTAVDNPAISAVYTITKISD